MAKESMKAREVKRAKLAKRYQHKRDEVAARVKSGEISEMEAWQELAKLPRNANPIRQHNRCQLTGRPKGYLVHALEHRIVFSIFVFYREILLDTQDAFQSHVLGDFNSIGTPWSNHFAAWTDEAALQVLFVIYSGFTIQPTQFLDVFSVQLLVGVCRDDILIGCSEK